MNGKGSRGSAGLGLGPPGHELFQDRAWKERRCGATLKQRGSGIEGTWTRMKLFAFMVLSWIFQGNMGDVFYMLMLRAPPPILNQLAQSGVRCGLQCDPGGKPKLRITVLDPQRPRCDPHPPSTGVPWKLAWNADSQAPAPTRPTESTFVS